MVKLSGTGSTYSKRWSDVVQNSSRHARLKIDTRSGCPLMHTSRKTGDVLLPCRGMLHSMVDESTSVAGVVNSREM